MNKYDIFEGMNKYDIASPLQFLFHFVINILLPCDAGFPQINTNYCKLFWLRGGKEEEEEHLKLKELYLICLGWLCEFFFSI